MTKLRQQTKKYLKDYEKELEDFKKNPDSYPEEEKIASVHDSEPEGSGDESSSEDDSSEEESDEEKPKKRKDVKKVFLIFSFK